jgi:tRNA pseudouridine38-40 synthase
MTQLRNLRLIISYDGTDFHGWQRQPGAPTVQECLESAIERILGEKVQVSGSGRTDAGVHALNQVANFQTACKIPSENLLKALNNTLQPTVRVKVVSAAHPRFHARYDARSKTYRYRILQAPVASPFVNRFVWHYPFPLDVVRMAQAAKLFEGEHDFTSFAAVAQALLPVQKGTAANDAQAGVPVLQDIAQPNMVRTIFTSRILRRTRTWMLIYEVTGSGFLHHMVRNIVGTLVEVGRGKLQPVDITRILEARDRTLAGPTAPAQGLCLVKVDYRCDEVKTTRAKSPSRKDPQS